MNRKVAIEISIPESVNNLEQLIDKVKKIVQESKLPNRITGKFIEIAGKHREVMAVLKYVTQVFAEYGHQTEFVLKMNIPENYLEENQKTRDDFT